MKTSVTISLVVVIVVVIAAVAAVGLTGQPPVTTTTTPTTTTTATTTTTPTTTSTPTTTTTTPTTTTTTTTLPFDSMIVSTTTSLYDTGMLDAMAETYLADFNIRLDFIAQGTGAALLSAQNGDADVVLVHAPSSENQFLAGGSVGARRIIAYNFFVIVGPPADPAGIRGMTPVDALKTIAAKGYEWVSRADNSGTNTKEKALWKAAKITPKTSNNWYIESGTGMGQTLTICSERGAYTLSDTGTFLAFQTEGLIDMEILVDQQKDLLNVYSVMACNPDVNSNVRFDLAIPFIEWLVSEDGQNVIGSYGVDKYGASLFYPAVDLLKTDSDPTMAEWIRSYAFLQGSECPPEWRLGQDQLYT